MRRTAFRSRKEVGCAACQKSAAPALALAWAAPCLLAHRARRLAAHAKAARNGQKRFAMRERTHVLGRTCTVSCKGRTFRPAHAFILILEYNVYRSERPEH